MPEEDMRKALNLGVGLILMVAPSVLDRVIAALKQKRERPFVMGEIANA